MTDDEWDELRKAWAGLKAVLWGRRWSFIATAAVVWLMVLAIELFWGWL